MPLDGINVVSTLKGAARIAVRDKHLALRGLHGRGAFPADRRAVGIRPTSEVLRRCVWLNFHGTHRWWKVNHAALQTRTTDAENYVANDAKF